MTKLKGSLQKLQTYIKQDDTFCNMATENHSQIFPLATIYLLTASHISTQNHSLTRLPSPFLYYLVNHYCLWAGLLQQCMQFLNTYEISVKLGTGTA